MYLRTGSVVRPISVSGERGRGLLGRRVVVGVGGRPVVQYQLIGIRCLFVHLDAHVIDHVDDVFDLFRVDDVIGQMIVDLGIGQETLFLALGDQILELGLLILIHMGIRRG